MQNLTFLDLGGEFAMVQQHIWYVPRKYFFSEDEEASREVGGAGEEEKGSEVAIL